MLKQGKNQYLQRSLFNTITILIFIMYSDQFRKNHVENIYRKYQRL